MRSAYAAATFAATALAATAIIAQPTDPAHTSTLRAGLPATQAVVGQHARSHYAERANRSTRRSPAATPVHTAGADATPPAPAPAPPSAPPRQPLTAVMLCIRQHESGGNYHAVNTSSGAAGAYQLMPAYADDWARRYGYPQWAAYPVTAWPPAVQDAVAAALYKSSGGHAWSDFAGYNCGW